MFCLKPEVLQWHADNQWPGIPLSIMGSEFGIFCFCFCLFVCFLYFISTILYYYYYTGKIQHVTVSANYPLAIMGFELGTFCLKISAVVGLCYWTDNTSLELKINTRETILISTGEGAGRKEGGHMVVVKQKGGYDFGLSEEGSYGFAFS